MERRKESRLSVDLPGSFVREERTHAMFFSQLSPNGCRLTTDDVELRVSDAIELYLGPVGPIDGIVRWWHGRAAGVEFDVALDAPVVAYFAAFVEETA